MAGSASPSRATHDPPGVRGFVKMLAMVPRATSTPRVMAPVGANGESTAQPSKAPRVLAFPHLTCSEWVSTAFRSM